ncbi:MAG: hypothetical protein AABY22_27905, partial [Nanoarchaeota archaeon]
VEVTAIENNQEILSIYKSFYPDDECIVGDAIEYVLENYEKFDFIWASPPCQTHSRIRFMASKSKINRKYKAKMPELSLYSLILFLKYFCNDKLWVVENVKPYYTELIRPTIQLGRHFIWSNFIIENRKFEKPVINHIKVTGKTNRYGFDLTKFKLKHRKDQIIRNCVNPKLALHIFNCAFREQQKLDVGVN